MKPIISAVVDFGWQVPSAEGCLTTCKGSAAGPRDDDLPGLAPSRARGTPAT